jgi:hypothetical protein
MRRTMVRSSSGLPMSRTPIATSSPLLQFLRDAEHIALVNINWNQAAHHRVPSVFQRGAICGPIAVAVGRVAASAIAMPSALARQA